MSRTTKYLDDKLKNVLVSLRLSSIKKHIGEKESKLTDQENWNNALHFVCGRKNVPIKIIKYLLKVGCDLKAKTLLGETVLHKYCEYSENFEIIQLLIANGVPLNCQEGYSKENSLHFLLRNPNSTNLNTLQTLLENGVSLMTKSNNTLTPFQYYMKYSKNPTLEAVASMTKYGSDWNYFRKESSALGLMSKNFSLGVEFYKLAHQTGAKFGSYINAQKETILINICKMKTDLKVLTFALENGGDPNLVDSNGYSPLFWLCYQTLQNVSAVNILLKFGAKVNVRLKRSCETPLHYLCKVSKPNVKIAESLFKAKAKPNLIMRKRITPIHSALSFTKPSLDLIRCLIQNGANINIPKRDLTTPLHTACRRNPFSGSIHLLISNGAKVNSKDTKGRTPLLQLLLTFAIFAK
ncbi:ankyrin repeat-containing protein [Anaeramoeba flamelloides]|uniref:Ankyrin repeat-containing protein n=1 Tax=Anaeramoeba flamelloides TaxID=1746091 RepID=A0AAV7ZTH5_9EUKA|nr:ankyrin repeat-containing protein [Anaeramoeba flamelloides]